MATQADLPELERLLDQATVDARTKRGGDVLLRLGRRAGADGVSLAEDLAGDDVEVVVGRIDEVPVGYAVVEWSVAADGTTHAELHELFVEPEAREVGVGEAMMELVLATATARGAVALHSTALPGDRGTKNFFESNEMVARAITVSRSLPVRQQPAAEAPGR